MGESSSQDSRESLLWDSAAQSLGDPLDHKRLWSSSTTSTHFDVTVVKSESLPDEMATAGAEISEQDLLDAGPSGIQTGSAPAQRGDTDATGRSVDTVSLVSTDTIVARNIPTPLPRTSRPHTPAVVGPQIRPLTPLLQHRPPVPPVASPRRFPQEHEVFPDIDLWTQRVDRILMDAEDRVLLYRGVRIAPSEVATFRTQAELLSAQLRDCYPHCNPTKQVVMANCRRAIGEVLVQLAEASHDMELKRQSMEA